MTSCSKRIIWTGRLPPTFLFDLFGNNLRSFIRIRRTIWFNLWNQLLIHLLQLFKIALIHLLLDSVRRCKNLQGAIHRALFSATYAHELQEWASLNLDNLVTVHIGDLYVLFLFSSSSSSFRYSLYPLDLNRLHFAKGWLYSKAYCEFWWPYWNWNMILISNI